MSRMRTVFPVFLSVALFVSCITAGCSSGGVSLDYDDSPDALIIEVRTGGGLPTPRVDRAPLFRLFGDGRAIKWSEGPHEGVLVEGRLSRTEVEELLEKIEGYGFFRLRDEYVDERVMDGSYTDITLNLKDEKKKVHVYMMEVRAFDEVFRLLVDYPLPDSKEYVPDTGYLVVEKVESGEETALRKVRSTSCCRTAGPLPAPPSATGRWKLKDGRLWT